MPENVCQHVTGCSEQSNEYEDTGEQVCEHSEWNDNEAFYEDIDIT